MLMKKKLKRRSFFVEFVFVGLFFCLIVCIKISFVKNDEDVYMINIFDEVYKVLKEKDDVWVKWYESMLFVEEELEEEKEGDGENGDGVNYLDDLGGLVCLL